jgi:hypothetical protein
MGPYDNETGEHIFFQELMDGEWFVDDEGYLYILPIEGAILDSEGPDNEIMDALDRAPSPVPQELIDRYHLCDISSTFRRWNPKEGFYHA